MKALRIEKGELHLSRACATHSKSLALKRVVQYTPNWVKNQQRMASTSNQETFRADVDGRLCIDLLRHVKALHPFTSPDPMPSLILQLCQIYLCDRR